MKMVAILSRDMLFSNMLVNELADANISSEICDSVKKSDDIVIIADLDSVSGEIVACGDTVIGFSVNEDSVSREVLDRCSTVLHRPFLIDEMIDLIQSITTNKGTTNQNSVEEMKSAAYHVEREARLQFGNDSVKLDGMGVSLSKNEYAILKKLYDNVNEAVSREELSGVLSSGGGNMCDVYVCRLRSKLESGGSERFIYTVRGKGYMLKI